MELSEPDNQRTFSFPLDGVLERNGFSPLVTILGALVLGFVAFQGVSLLLFVIVIAVNGDLGLLTTMDPSTLVETFASELLLANTVGQFLGLLLLGWFFARLHTSRPVEMLRIRGADWRLTVLAVIGLVALVPLVQWVGTIMDGLPWPESIREFEQVQMDLIDQVLATNLGFLFTLLTMAATPALCEELFFRGYIQRQSERMFKRWLPGVVFTGVIFGLYHLRLTQALPLSMLGVYMAYVVWRSNSLVPGVIVHFLNNGFAVTLGAMVSSSDKLSAEDLESIDIPGYVVISAVLIFIGVVHIMHRLGATSSTDQSVALGQESNL